jgi:hypothetical protein
VRADLRIRYQDQAQKLSPRIAAWATPHSHAPELDEAPVSSPTTVTHVVTVSGPGSGPAGAGAGGADPAALALYAVAALAAVGAVVAVALAALSVRRRRRAERALRLANVDSLVLGTELTAVKRRVPARCDPSTRLTLAGSSALVATSSAGALDVAVPDQEPEGEMRDSVPRALSSATDTADGDSGVGVWRADIYEHEGVRDRDGAGDAERALPETLG